MKKQTRFTTVKREWLMYVFDRTTGKVLVDGLPCGLSVRKLRKLADTTRAKSNKSLIIYFESMVVGRFE